VDTTRWGQVVDALVARMRATNGFEGPQDTGDSIRVYDGPEIDADTNEVTQYLVIGLPADGPGEGESGTTSQTPGPMATPRPRDEAGVILCRAAAQLGDVNSKGARDACLAILAAVETELRAPFDGPTVGLSTPRLVVQMESSTQPIRQYILAGSCCEIDFSLKYETRLN